MKIAVYAHYKPDGSIFYIGKGTERRVYSRHSRSAYWKNVVSKYGYEPKILARFNCEKEAFEHEKFLISCLKDLGHPLVNLTNGGEGTSGLKWKKESREKLSNTRKGTKFSLETIKKIQQSKLGSKHSSETIKKMKEARKSGTHNSKPLEVCGIKFQSMTSFAKFVGMSAAGVRKWVLQNNIEKLEKAYESAK